MAKKTASSRRRSSGAARTTAVPAKARRTASGRKVTTKSKASPARGTVKKHVGDVLGISRTRASKSIPRGGGRPKGIEIPTARRKGLRPARVVGGVRGRGR